MSAEAKRIYQDWLDAVSRDIMGGDVAAVAARMAYPQTMATRDGAVRFERPAQMEAAAAEFGASLRRMGGRELVRICEEAAFEADGTRIAGRHTSHVLKAGSYVLPPYASRMWLRLDGETWLGDGIEADMLYRDCTIFTPDQLRLSREAGR
jgi:hypothetical protein